MHVLSAGQAVEEVPKENINFLWFVFPLIVSFQCLEDSNTFFLGVQGWGQVTGEATVMQSSKVGFTSFPYISGSFWF